ncbi:MAG: class I SAM-dependent methyltransferase [Actinomycetales bacterium]
MTSDAEFGYAHTPEGTTIPANRAWWDAEAVDYYREHGEFLGDDDLCWGPEGLRESTAHLLGDLRGLTVLEVGCGAGQGARWAAGQGAAQVVALDLSIGMLDQGRRLSDPATARRVGFVLGDATRLPMSDACVDLAFSAYGAVPFVDHPESIMAEVARVLRPGGRWVFSVTHPVRWAFPDDPGPGGLTATRSYFDRRPYRELDGHGRPTYVEHHRTLADRVRDVVAAGLVIDGLVEPEWQAGDAVWGGWSRLRGELLPGTLIVQAHRPA